MTENNTEKFLEGFRQWWQEQGHTRRSADSYCSGIRRVNKEFFLPIVNKDLFAELEKAVAKGCAVDYINALTGIIGAKVFNAEDLKERKHYQDMRSCLCKFTEYITERQESILMPGGWSKTNDVIFSDIVSESDYQYYDYESLMRILSHEIRARGYINTKKKIYFSMRLLERLFFRSETEQVKYFDQRGILSYTGKSINFKRWYSRWLQSILNRVKIHTIKGDFTLSQAEGLLIERSTRRVWIVDRERHRTIPLMTETESGLQPMQAESLLDIKLKRSECIGQILERLWDVMPVMRRIAYEIRKAVDGQTITNEDGTVLSIDSFQLETLKHMSLWYMSHADWTIMAPLLSLVRAELGYIAAATHLTLTSTTDNLRNNEL